ncbi:hypothetical protein DVH05_002164 [Phytophthora capsici]|nr:hypothetical protein DVH05_002164 [Phytophthora capsici]
MRSFLRRLRRSTSSKAFREITSSEEGSTSRQSRFSRTSKALKKALVPAIQPVCESPETPRKRDRLKSYLTRRRASQSSNSSSYLWPAMLSTDKEEVRSSDDTEEGDVYMVDYSSDSDSDDSLFEDDYVTPPVAVPEMYRRQDRQGGITVAGVRVLFTYAGFKRQQMMVKKLQSVPEAAQLTAQLGMHREFIVIGAY